MLQNVISQPEGRKGHHSSRLCIPPLCLCHLTENLSAGQSKVYSALEYKLIPGLARQHSLCHRCDWGASFLRHMGGPGKAVYSVAEWTSGLLFHLSCQALQLPNWPSWLPHEPSHAKIDEGKLGRVRPIEPSLCVVLYVHIIFSHSTGGSAAAD